MFHASKYSGIVINQNQVPASGTDFLVPDGVSWVIQEFFLPVDYRRGTDSGELQYPALSEIHLLVGVDDAMNETASIEFKLEYQVFGLGWIELTTGTATGTHVDGDKVWMHLILPDLIEMDKTKAESRMRIQLLPDPDSGITKLWFARPNPLAISGGSKAYAANGTTPLTHLGEQYSFNFRILGLIADEGIDFLGNSYRSAVVRNYANSINTALGADPDSYWLSKPNPSKFAIESLYFDMRKTHMVEDEEVTSEDAIVVDRVLIDPITPGIYFNIYYSVEGAPGITEDQWENKLWTRVPQTFRMERREAHVLPEPIVAKFIKIEFSHLQARYYAPGNFQQSIRYKKHPKWVLDYFLARAQIDANFMAERVAVTYDAIDLAYNYYLDDLGQEPQTTIDVGNTALTQITSFLSDRTDSSDRIDASTLDRLNLALEPYRNHPALRGYATTLLGDYARQSVDPNVDYSVEGARPESIPTADVSTLNRDRVVVEQNYPVMFFFLTARHKYREIEAKFSHDRAYFAGVRQIAFLRDNYMTAYDTTTYIEPNADTLNVERNEF